MTQQPDSQDAGVPSLEIERKYEVPASAELPGADAFRAIGIVADSPVVHRLSAVYFDTGQGDLARLGLALRVRDGGKDAGWHLKQRGGAGVRELFWPPNEGMPAGLRDAIRDRIGDAAERVSPIAELQTDRTIVMLRDGEGRDLVELADDLVRARSEAGDGAQEVSDHSTAGASAVTVDPPRAPVLRAWREWEAELLSEDPAILERVEPLLLAAGAERSLSFAKIARATGQLIPVARAEGADAAVIAALEALDASDRAAGERDAEHGAARDAERGSTERRLEL